MDFKELVLVGMYKERPWFSYRLFDNKISYSPNEIKYAGWVQEYMSVFPWVLFGSPQ